MRDLTDAVRIIKKYEGCVLHAYRDVRGILTIGWGHTPAQGGEVITQAEADAMFDTDLHTFAAHVESLVKVPCSNNEFCALVSFAYNEGVGRLTGSTLLRDLNSGQPKETVANEFLHWVYAGHQVYPGLVARRKEERDLFLG